MTLRLKDFQVTGRDFLASHTEALLADEMGLGKTIQAISACVDLSAKKILVVCPASLKLNWAAEFNKWDSRKLDIQIIYGSKTKIHDYPITIINYDLLIYPPILRQLLKYKFVVGVFDEAHYLKGMTSSRTKAVLYRGGVASRCKHKWFLTGTPVLNRPIELYPLLKACVPRDIYPYNSEQAFGNHFCDAYWTGFEYNRKGASNLSELKTRLNKNFMLRRLKSEVLKELPDKQYQLIPMRSSSTKVEELIEKELTWTKNEAKRQVMGLDGGELAILRRELALAKLPTAIKLIDNIMLSKDKLVVFTYHRDITKHLYKESALKYPSEAIHGGQNPLGRQAAIDYFQNGNCQLLFCQIQAGGVGITLTAADQCLFVESSWVPGEIDQAVDRLHRMGQLNNVLAQFLVIEGSLEEHMLKTVIEKKEIIKQIV